MKIIRHPKKKKLKGCVVALGTFDGVHRGHQKVIKSAVKEADKIGAASLVITFEPHPQQLIAPERGLRLLTSLEEREAMFCELGVDGVVVVSFNRRMQKLSYQQFVKKYLVGKLGVSHVFIGFDYAFGKGRSGDAKHLRILGKKLGFKVTVIGPVLSLLKPVKSRVIRELISHGDFARALRLLGHSYQIEGKVVKGHGRGRELGFPTANLAIDRRKLIPAYGVYAGSVKIGSKMYKCAINIGAQPTFGIGDAAVEVHVIKFKGNLHGRKLKVTLTKRLRDEIHFSDVAKLKRQIAKDIKRV